jgi:hypothetical protein
MLRVAEEHAGKALRCPACNHISTAPGGTQPAKQPQAARWHMRTPEGQTYGPVVEDELQRWVREGRLAVDCFLATDPAGPWEPAAARYPVLMLQAPKTAATPAPTVPTFQSPSPFAANSPAFAAPVHGRYYTPHRGGLILVLGLLGFLIGCPIFSLMAWVMGTGDLREIHSGRMDPSGEGLTRAGQILGMIVAIPCILFSVIVLFIIVVAAANG